MGAILVASFSLVSAQVPHDSLASVPADTASAVPADAVDSSLILLSNMRDVPDSVPNNTLDSVRAAAPDTSVRASVPDTAAKPVRPSRSVLYLGGGERSAWFHLGVLYAIESYQVPVDSIVGVSWGAFVGFLWAKGVPLDDIQRILLDPYIVELVGRNEMDELNRTPERTFELPVSVDGMPSLRHRFSLSADTAGNLYRNVKTLEPDLPHIKRSLARLRLQESLYRQPAEFVIPFAVELRDGKLSKSLEDVYKNLPLIENEENGELDPYLPVPENLREGELPLVSVAIPGTVPPRDSRGTSLLQAPP
jgi:NTE family protein